MASSSLDCASEIQLFFIQNITDLGLGINQLKLSGMVFDDSNVDEWIEITYNPVFNELIGLNGTTTGRIEATGLLSVYCRNEQRMECYKMADDVSTFLNGKILPLDIRIGIGQHNPIIDLESNLFELKVTFEVRQD